MSESVCERERERERECVCVCVWKKEKEKMLKKDVGKKENEGIQSK